MRHIVCAFVLLLLLYAGIARAQRPITRRPITVVVKLTGDCRKPEKLFIAMEGEGPREMTPGPQNSWTLDWIDQRPKPFPDSFPKASLHFGGRRTFCRKATSDPENDPYVAFFEFPCAGNAADKLDINATGKPDVEGGKRVKVAYTYERSLVKRDVLSGDPDLPCEEPGAGYGQPSSPVDDFMIGDETLSMKFRDLTLEITSSEIPLHLDGEALLNEFRDERRNPRAPTVVSLDVAQKYIQRIELRVEVKVAK